MAQGRAIIIGAGIGGLSAAIHLRLAGREVTVLEANEQVGGRANRLKRAGFQFDTGPSLLNYPWVFEELFAAAGRGLRDYLELLPVDPSVEFRWPDGEKFQLSSSLPRLLAECERLEPGSSASLLAYLRDAARKYDLSFQKLATSNQTSAVRWFAALSPKELAATAVWRSLDSELARFFRSRRIREALGSYAMYLGGSPYDLPGLFSILAYGELAYGLWLPKGGIYALVQAMERLAQELGVEIRTGSPVRRILHRDGRVIGVELRGGEVDSSGLVVSNVDVPTTEDELIESSGARAPRMTPAVLTFYWGVRGHVDGIGHHTIFLPRDSRAAFNELCRKGQIPGEIPFYVSIPSGTDPSLAPPGDSTVFVLVPVPVISQLPDLDWPRESGKIRNIVLARLGLDADRMITEQVWTPEEWRRRFGLYDGSAFGAAHTLMQVGPFRSPNFSKDYRGLYYVGASTTPGTGMPMGALGGRMTAERIAADAH
jgi:phytoene desaturase